MDHEQYPAALTEGWDQPAAEELQWETYSDNAGLPKRKVTYVPFGTWQSYLYNRGVLLGKFLTLVQFCLISLNFCKQILGTKISHHYHCHYHH